METMRETMRLIRRNRRKHGKFNRDNRYRGPDPIDIIIITVGLCVLPVIPLLLLAGY